MSLCDDGHDELCYEGRICPACKAIDSLKADLEEARGKIDDLENQLKEAGER